MGRKAKPFRGALGALLIKEQLQLFLWIKKLLEQQNSSRFVMKIKDHLSKIAAQNNLANDTLQFPDCEIASAKIRVIMINEVVPKNPEDWFYSKSDDSENRRNAFALFEGVGVHVKSIGDVAIKATNMIAKAKTNTRRNICPAGAAGRRRHWGNEEFYWDGIRLFPSYITLSSV